MKRPISILILVATIIGCSGQNQLTPDKMAENACQCFDKLKGGTLDERLTPCLSQPINDHIEEIHEGYKPNEPVDVAVQEYMMDVTTIMIHSCDQFYLEMDSMYTNMYPETDYSLVQNQIELISDSITSTNLSDTSKIALLNEKIALLTKARRFKEVMESIEQMSTEFPNESEKYWVKAYAYRTLGEYDKALKEIDKGIDSGDKDSRIFKEMIKRKKSGR